jgi:hypothetical protein
MRPLHCDLQLDFKYETSSFIWVAADLEHVGHGNMYASLYLMPALYALIIEVHTAVSTDPVDLYPRGITNEYPDETKQEAAEDVIVLLTSTPLVVEVEPVTQHCRSDGPTQ